MKNNKIRIVADSKIPFLKGVLEPFSDIDYLDPSEINNNILKDKDAIIIRSRTICNSILLDRTNIKFIATATIGFDHIDISYCESNNIKWISAPGCNSSSVMQYIASALIIIARRKNLNLSDLTIGVIGVGNVGSKVARLAALLGMKVLLNDPPRMRREGNKGFVSLEKLISESDIITFHVPLNKEGIDKTFHMADESFLRNMKKKKILINTSRGPVIETSALKNAIKCGIIIGCVLDVWENEPEIDRELLNLIDIATPHIAGYSADGKANGTSICIKGISSFFNLSIDKDWYPSELPVSVNPKVFTIDCKEKSDREVMEQAILASYNIIRDDEILRNSIETFEKQRSNYPIRREFSYYSIKLLEHGKGIIQKINDLGFKITS
jgi:erythronate-4-phosphate dehydrogenase